MVKSGKSLERLVGAIETALGDSKAVRVELRKRLVDRTTGRLRERDVVLTFNRNKEDTQN